MQRKYPTVKTCEEYILPTLLGPIGIRAIAADTIALDASTGNRTIVIRGIPYRFSCTLKINSKGGKLEYGSWYMHRAPLDKMHVKNGSPTEAARTAVSEEILSRVPQWISDNTDELQQADYYNKWNALHTIENELVLATENLREIQNRFDSAEKEFTK